MSSEVYNLAWIDFESSSGKMSRNLLNDQNFSDVTLACGGGKQFQVHKVIISACSSFFQNILLKNPHPHPLIYLNGLDGDCLESVIQFMYLGQTEVKHEDLDHFIKVAKDLQVSGLNHDVLSKETQIISQEKLAEQLDEVSQGFLENSKFHQQMEDVSHGFLEDSSFHKDDDAESKIECKPNVVVDVSRGFLEDSNSPRYSDEVIEINPIYPQMIDNTACESRPKNLLTFHRDTKHQGQMYSCEKCERQFTQKKNLKVHFESQHEGKVYPCNLCDAKYSAPTNLSRHKNKFHV